MPDVEPVQLSAEEVRLALLEESKRYPQHRPWETWEDDVLRQFHGKVPYRVLAEKLGRTISMVSHRLENLGLTKTPFISHSKKTTHRIKTSKGR